jgi:hypothetical protein
MVFDVRETADVQDKLLSPSARRQFVADAFYVPVRQTQSFSDLSQPQPRQHLLLGGLKIVCISRISITTLLRNQNRGPSVPQFVPIVSGFPPLRCVPLWE